jgi:hypothetical protein
VPGGDRVVAALARRSAAGQGAELRHARADARRHGAVGGAGEDADPIALEAVERVDGAVGGAERCAAGRAHHPSLTVS